MAKLMSKSELIQKIVAQHANKMTRKDVKAVIESIAAIGYKELNRSGAFVMPGFAKFVVIKKPATKERSGINPFTKEPMIFKAKAARKVVKAQPVKAVKAAVLESTARNRLVGCNFEFRWVKSQKQSFNAYPLVRLTRRRRPMTNTPKAISTKQLAYALAEQHQLTKKHGQQMLEDLVDLITKHLR